MEPYRPYVDQLVVEDLGGGELPYGADEGDQGTTTRPPDAGCGDRGTASPADAGSDADGDLAPALLHG